MAGGWSVSAHLVSPLTSGLFHRAIVQGGALHGWHPETRAERAHKGHALADILGCNQPGPADTLTCLRSLPAEEIRLEAEKMGYFRMGGFVVGDAFLPQPPTELLVSPGPHPGVEVLMGGTSEEGTLGLFGYLGNVEEVLREGTAPGEEFYEHMIEAIAATFPSRLEGLRDNLIDLVVSMYETNSPQKVTLSLLLCNTNSTTM